MKFLKKKVREKLRSLRLFFNVIEKSDFVAKVNTAYFSKKTLCLYCSSIVKYCGWRRRCRFVSKAEYNSGLKFVQPAVIRREFDTLHF